MFDLSPDELTALMLSLKVSLVAAGVSLPLGIAVAYLLARGRFPGLSLIDALVHLPLTLPPVVTGFLLLLIFGAHGPVGRFLGEYLGIVFAFRWTGAALAAGIMGFPLMVRAIRLSIEAVDRGIEEAACSLGASPLAIFVTITLPLALPGIFAGTMLAFGRAMGEFGATVTFVANIPGETQTLPAAIYSFTQTPGGDGPALRLTLISIGVAFLATVLSDWLARRMQRRLAA